MDSKPAESELEVEIELVGAPPETFIVDVKRAGSAFARALGDLGEGDAPSVLHWPSDLALPDIVRRSLDQRIGRWTLKSIDG